MKKIMIVFIFIEFVFCQGVLVEKGNSVLGGDISVVSNSQSTGYGPEIVYSLNGFFDFGVSYSFSSVDTDIVPISEIKVKSYIPYIAFNFRKSERLGGFRVTAGIISGSIDVNYNTASIPARNSTFNGFAFGGTLFIPASTESLVAFLPYCGFNFAFLSSDNEYSANSKAAGVGVLIKTNTKSIGFKIQPGLSFDLSGGDNSISYGVSMGIFYQFSNN